MDDLDSILKTLKINLARIYGSRLKRIFLYGSYARKEQTEDSDIDVLIVLDDFENVYKEISYLSPTVSEISLEHDTLISVIPCRLKDFDEEREILYRNVKKEGIPV